MSLADKKSALFGKTPMSSAQEEKKAAPKTSQVCISRVSIIFLTESTDKTPNIDWHLSSSQGEENGRRKREWRAWGSLFKNHCEYSDLLICSLHSDFRQLFQWSPDHLAASAAFDAAANCYKTAEENDLALSLYLKVSLDVPYHLVSLRIRQQILIKPHLQTQLQQCRWWKPLTYARYAQVFFLLPTIFVWHLLYYGFYGLFLLSSW